MLLQTLCRGWGLEAHVLLLNDTVYLDVSHLRAVRRSLVTLDGQRPLCLGGRGLKAVLLWSEPRGAYSTFWAAARCQCELHHPDTVRLAQPVAEMHHGRRPADAAVKTLDFQGNELLFLFNYSSLCFSQNAIVNTEVTDILLFVVGQTDPLSPGFNQLVYFWSNFWSSRCPLL